MSLAARPERVQTLGEEVANAISHGAGLIAAIVAFPILVTVTAKAGSTMNVVAACIFATTMVLMYLFSTIYHAVPAGRFKQFFRKMDHAAIYLLIAGSYTPFTMGILKGAWGWTLFGVIWAIATLGLVLMFWNKLSRPWISNGLYLLMGWLVLIAIVPLVQKLSPEGLAWLVAGGLAYTGGVIFYATDAKLRFGHFVWHLFVLAGTVCHFFAILWHAY